MDNSGDLLALVAIVLAILALLGAFGFIGEGCSDCLLVNGTRPLTGNWNAGAFNITASYFFGNILMSSVNISDWSTYINQAVLTTSNPTFNSVTATTRYLGNPSSASTPTYSFSGYSNYGLWYDSGNSQVKIAINGGSKLIVSSSLVMTACNLYPVGTLTYSLGAGGNIWSVIYVGDAVIASGEADIMIQSTNSGSERSRINFESGANNKWILGYYGVDVFNGLCIYDVVGDNMVLQIHPSSGGVVFNDEITSLGWINSNPSVTDVTSGKTWSTYYQNTNGKTIMVYFSPNVGVGEYCTVYLSSASSGGSAILTYVTDGVSFIVPDGWYYCLVRSGGSSVITSIFEEVF